MGVQPDAHFHGLGIPQNETVQHSFSATMSSFLLQGTRQSKPISSKNFLPLS